MKSFFLGLELTFEAILGPRMLIFSKFIYFNKLFLFVWWMDIEEFIKIEEPYFKNEEQDFNIFPCPMYEPFYDQ